MLSSLGAAITGLNTEQQELNVIGNNLANQSTPGFKAGELDFATLLSQTFNTGTQPNPTTGQGGIDPFQLGMGTETTGVAVNQAEGPLTQTGNPLDFAIQGNGYFILTGPAGTTYTRAGLFNIDANGNLVDRQTGEIVQGYTNVTAGTGTPPGPATVSTTASTTLQGLMIPQQISNPPGGGTGTYQLLSFSVGQNGVIIGTYQATSSTVTPSTVTVQLGQIALAQFANPNGLVSEGVSQYAVGPDAIPPGATGPTVSGANTAGAGQIIEGAQEGSNTNLVQSMADLVGASGAYDASAKVITVAQQMQTALDQMVQ
jgi:flagellar hook protein FlgE